jgi:hypothetical protein
MSPNPFAVEAWFDFSCALTFAVPVDDVRRRLPPWLEPDVFAGRWGFFVVAAVQVRRLRPAALPQFLGQDFILVGYRFFVSYRSRDGRTLRGLMVVRSETDSRRMAVLGNWFTRYRYVRSDLRAATTGSRLEVGAPDTGFNVRVEMGSEAGASIPAGSPFATWQEARRFCGPMPFTFSWDEGKRSVAIVEGVRSNWQPQPVRVEHWRIPYLDSLGFSEVRLANAFAVRDVPYRWERARLEPWPRTGGTSES